MFGISSWKKFPKKKRYFLDYFQCMRHIFVSRFPTNTTNIPRTSASGRCCIGKNATCCPCGWRCSGTWFLPLACAKRRLPKNDFGCELAGGGKKRGGDPP